MALISPIDQSQQQQVLDKTHYYIELARRLYQHSIASIPINFKLTGRAAGMYHVRHGKRYIRYNPYIFAKYFEDNLHNTVPHEVAHYVADLLFGIKNIRPHGKEWQQIMRQFGIRAKASCNYDLTDIPQRLQQRFKYHCSCRTFEITTRRHNMIRSGRKAYLCKSCKTPIKHTDE